MIYGYSVDFFSLLWYYLIERKLPLSLLHHMIWRNTMGFFENINIRELLEEDESCTFPPFNSVKVVAANLEEFLTKIYQHEEV